MTGWALALGVVGAVSGLAAAAFSGLNLWLSGRRETQKWLRESLLDGLVTILDSSFRRPTGRAYRRQAGGHVGHDPEEELALLKDLAEAVQAHERQESALSRVRFLADPRVVEAAAGLHDVDCLVHDRVFGDPLPTPMEWKDLRHMQRKARDLLIKVAREDLGLREQALPTRLRGML